MNDERAPQPSHAPQSAPAPQPAPAPRPAQAPRSRSISPRLVRAMDTAATAHDGQVRKGSGIPYVAHLFGVMHIASTVTDDEDVLIAALLHDALEDVPDRYPEAAMRRDFGDRVTDIVVGVTKDASLGSWQDRADVYLRHLEHDAPDESVLVSACDKLHNLTSILADHANLGDGLWTRFNSGKERQQWWYAAIAGVVARRLPHFPLNDEFTRLVAELQRI